MVMQEELKMGKMSANERGVFDIATENGDLFCRCDDSGESPVFFGKQGKLTLDLLLKQAHNRELAKQMRGKKFRQHGSECRAV